MAQRSASSGAVYGLLPALLLWALIIAVI